MLSDQAVERIYEELDSLVVPLAHDPTYGPAYLERKLMDVSAKQERVADMLVALNKAIGEVLQDRITQEAVVKVSTGPALEGEREKLRIFRSQHERLKFCMNAVNVRKARLSKVSADIRLLLDCMKVGLLGQGPRPPANISADHTLRSTVRPDVEGTVAGAVQEFYARPVAEPAPAASNLDELFEDQQIEDQHAHH